MVPFHAGTSAVNGKIVTSGGRVLVVSAYAPTLQGALDAAYAGVEKIDFEGKVFRRDIAHRCVLQTSFLCPSLPTKYVLICRTLSATTASSGGLTYAQAGVSVDAGNALVEAIKPYVRATRRTGADAEIGGFGGVFDLKATGYRDPVLVSGTDGVGTKLRVAMDVGLHDFVGTSTLTPPRSAPGYGYNNVHTI